MTEKTCTHYRVEEMANPLPGRRPPNGRCVDCGASVPHSSTYDWTCPHGVTHADEKFCDICLREAMTGD